MDQEGSKANPIELLDDDQEMRIKEQKVAFERNRQALYQAHMGSQFDVLAAIIKLDINGTEEQKNRVLKSRILKFFNHGTKSINVESEYFRKRREPDYSNSDTVPKSDELIIYGVDFLNAKQVKQKFAGMSIEVKWLDDSHCKVKFESPEEALKGLEMNLRNKNQDTVKIENEDMEVPRGWFELQPYNYMAFVRRLYGRYAASNENDLQIEKSNDYHMYQEAKKKFEQKMKQEVTESRYFEVMKKYKLINEDKLRERQSLRRNRDGYDRNRDGYERNRDGYDRNRDGFDRNRDGFDRNRDGYDRNRGGDGRRGERDGRDRNAQQRFNNYTRNRDGGNRNNYNDRREGNRGREEYKSNNREEYQERSRQKSHRNDKNDELDNLSIVSKPRSRAPPRKERKFSQSICSNPSPVRGGEADDDAKSSYSFILNLDDGNSNQILNDFNNLSIGDIPDEGRGKFSKRGPKEEEVNLSIVEDSLYDNQNRVLDTSINMQNNQSMSKKKNLNTSIVFEESMQVQPPKKLNTSIQQITIYD